MAIVLDNRHITELLEDANRQVNTLESSLYTQYQNVFKLSQSINFRGAAADTIKGYFTDVTVNHINTYLNLLTDVKESITTIKNRFLDFESRESGKVSETDISNAQTGLRQHETTFNEIDSRLAQLNNAASAYISVVNIMSGQVDADFNDVHRFLSRTKVDLREVDAENLSTVESLLERIDTFFNSIRQTNIGYFDNTGNIKLDKVANITEEDWYVSAPTATLDRLVYEDPFFFDQNYGSVAEGQYAQSWASDTYVTAGYAAVSGSTLVSVDGRTATASASGSILEGSAYGQFTDYATGEASGDVLSGSATVRSGFGDGYYGYALEADGRVAGADGRVQLGPDEANFFLEGSAEVLSANGFVKNEFQDQNNYAIGFKGEAIGAQVEGGLGFDLFKVQNTKVEYADVDGQGNKSNQVRREATEEISLLGLNVDGSIGPQVGAGMYIETQQALEAGPLSINSTTLSVSGKLGLGIDLNLTIPTLGFNF